MKNLIKCILPVFVLAILLAGMPAFAQTNYGTGPGCSAIEDVLATDLNDGDSFTGRIGRSGVTGTNPAGRSADPDTDGDGFTPSLEGCINDALIGYCGDIDEDDSSCYSVVAGGTSRNRQSFTVTFDDVSACCGISECSDKEDNDNNCKADFGGADGLPADEGCADYSDDDESGGADICS